MANIVLGVTGGIAAYKIPSLVSALRNHRQHDVRVVATDAALQFVTQLSLETMSGHPLYHSMWNGRDLDATHHISLAKWLDILVIAPATANTLAKMAHGTADNLLTTLYLSAAAKPVLVFPAMNTEMWHHPTTQENIGVLRIRHVVVHDPDTGTLACGDQGDGKFPDIREICDEIDDVLSWRPK